MFPPQSPEPSASKPSSVYLCSFAALTIILRENEATTEACFFMYLYSSIEETLNIEALKCLIKDPEYNPLLVLLVINIWP